jgi:SsrA-binding protein
MSDISNKVNIKNKKAYFEYEILDKYTAGVKLLGTEIKSVRQSKVNIGDSFCSFVDGNLYVRNMHISEYSCGSFYNHEAKRDRVLLLKAKELKKIEHKTKEKGFTIIPLYMFINERGFAKMEIGVAKGKQEFDKRNTIKERDSKVELARAKKI